MPKHSDAPGLVSVGALGQLAPHDTGQLPAETVQGVVLSSQTPAEAESPVDVVQPQVPQGGGGGGTTGQLFAATVQSSPLLLQTPADALSVVEVVQLQVPQGGSTRQLFAATVQGWDELGQGSPPHPADTVWTLDCVPALDASAVDAVHSQLPQTHWQSRGCVPRAIVVDVSSQLPALQPGLQVLVIVWVKVVSQACVDTSGDHADQLAPQTIRVSQYRVPVAPRLVEQSPVLQPGLQVLLWVKARPQQCSEVAGDQEAVPQLTEATGFSAEHVLEFDPPLLPSQRHW